MPITPDGDVRSPPAARRPATMLALLTAGFALGLLVSVGLTGLEGHLLPGQAPAADPGAEDAWSTAQRALDQGAFAEARVQLLPLAEAGQANAQQALGRLYRDGLGGSRSHARAYDWFRLAARQGDVDAQLALAGLYAHGYGVDRDLARAAFWSTRARDDHR